MSELDTTEKEAAIWTYAQRLGRDYREHLRDDITQEAALAGIMRLRQDDASMTFIRKDMERAAGKQYRREMQFQRTHMQFPLDQTR